MSTKILLVYLCTNITSLSGFHGSRYWTDSSSIFLVFWKTQFSQGLVVLHAKNLKHTFAPSLCISNRHLCDF